MLDKVRRDIKVIFALLLGLGALSLFVSFLSGFQSHWFTWPTLISGVLSIFVLPCMLAGWYFVLGVLEWRQSTIGRERLISPLALAIIALIAALFFVLCQVGAAYIEVQSFKQNAPAVDQRLLRISQDRTDVDLANDKVRKAHELYAEARFLKSGTIHVVTDLDGEEVAFLPDLNALHLRAEINERKLRSTLISATLLIGAGFCCLFLVLCLVAASRWT